MSESYLIDSVIFLAAAVLIVLLFKRFGLNSILVYLAADASSARGVSNLSKTRKPSWT
jgi:Kef-type K+ transport system membrane component KefB